MNKELFGISFHAWQYIYTFPLIILLIAVYIWQYYKRRTLITYLVGNRSYDLLNHYFPVRQFIKLLCAICAILLLWLALMRPSWGKIDQKIEQEGRDVLIALDISRSMLAQDVKPNRLEYAKKKVRALVQKLHSERVGLLIFSGTPLVQCPLTTDHDAFFMFLNQLDAETISFGTTALDLALKKAVTVLSDGREAKTKLLVVLTDGEDFSSNLKTVKEQVIKDGLILFTIGIGTSEGAPIPIVDENGKQIEYQKDEKGVVVMSRLNEGILRALAHESGGQYVHAVTNDDSDIVGIINSVEQYEKQKFDQKNVIQEEERYPYFIAIALIFFLIEWIL